MKKMIKIFLLIILYILIFINLLSFVIKHTSLNEKIGLIPFNLLMVESGSMEPKLFVGDLLIGWETPYKDLQIGDIITYINKDELVTHEIIRKDGSRFITKGLANNVEDKGSVGFKEYCSKVVFVIPRVGFLLEMVVSPISLTFCIILILFLFFGKSGLDLITVKIFNRESEIVYKKPNILRVTIALSLISCFLISPYYTVAKYKGKLNEYAIVGADAKYFKSNLLSKDGSNYKITGWNCSDYMLSLTLKNFDNTLLYNESGTDVRYKIRILKCIEEGYKTDYSISLGKAKGLEELQDLSFVVPKSWHSAQEASYAPSNSNGTSDYGVFTLQGSDSGPQEQVFNIYIRSDTYEDEFGEEVSKIGFGDKIKFLVYASTSAKDEYLQELSGEFVIEAWSTNQFITFMGVNEKSRALVNFNIKTNYIGGDSQRKIKVSWDADKVYINEYESTILNLKAENPSWLTMKNPEGRGEVIMYVKAFSNLNLEFFKYNSQEDIIFGNYLDEYGILQNGDIVVEEVVD